MVLVSGSQVWGNDIGGNQGGQNWNGNYRSNVHSFLVSPSIDTTGETGLFLGYWRWLTVQEAERDLTIAHVKRPGQLEVRYERFKSFGSLRRMQDAFGEIEILLASPLVETEPQLYADGAFLSGGFGDHETAIERRRSRAEKSRRNCPRRSVSTVS